MAKTHLPWPPVKTTSVGDGDTGPKYGGMGPTLPLPVVTPRAPGVWMREVIRPVPRLLLAEGTLHRLSKPAS